MADRSYSESSGSSLVQGDVRRLENPAHGFAFWMREVLRKFWIFCLILPPMLAILGEFLRADEFGLGVFNFIWHSSQAVASATLESYFALMVALAFLAFCRTMLHLSFGHQANLEDKFFPSINCESNAYLFLEKLLLLCLATWTAFGSLFGDFIAIFTIFAIHSHFKSPWKWVAIFAILASMLYGVYEGYITFGELIEGN